MFKFAWEGQKLPGAIHAEFMWRVRAKHGVVGGDKPVAKFCGYEFAYDRARGTIHIHQQKTFAAA